MNAIKSRHFNPIWEPINVADQAWRQAVSGRPLTIEIGAGVGLHPLTYAQKHPDKFIIAIEKTVEKFNKFSNSYNKIPGLTNLLPIHANAIQWISQNILINEVSEYYILYPNPYPKASQSNKRFHNMPFMQYLFSTMRVGCTLTIATNIAELYLETREKLLQVSGLTLVIDKQINAASIEPRTHFERKYLARGEKCYELVFVKS